MYFSLSVFPNHPFFKKKIFFLLLSFVYLSLFLFLFPFLAITYITNIHTHKYANHIKKNSLAFPFFPISNIFFSIFFYSLSLWNYNVSQQPQQQQQQKSSSVFLFFFLSYYILFSFIIISFVCLFVPS